MAEPLPQTTQTYERHGCLIHWLKSPFIDMNAMRVVGTKENIEALAKVYEDIYPNSDLLLGDSKRVSDSEWVAIWFRWIDEI